MQSFNIVKNHTAKKSFRVDSVIGTYDLSNEKVQENFKGHVDLDFDWNVGLIYGRSGTGKSSIAKELFGNYIINEFHYKESTVLDDMPKECSVNEITKTFNSVGFSSVVSWLKPYEVLSNGEKMRVDLARAILCKKEMVVFDEYTSVVDREVAKIGSYALQKHVRKNNLKFIAVTCHEDVNDWLIPDWILNTNDMNFEKCKKKLQKSGSKYIKQNINQNIGECLVDIII